MGFFACTPHFEFYSVTSWFRVEHARVQPLQVGKTEQGLINLVDPYINRTTSNLGTRLTGMAENLEAIMNWGHSKFLEMAFVDHKKTGKGPLLLFCH